MDSVCASLKHTSITILIFVFYASDQTVHLYMTMYTFYNSLSAQMCSIIILYIERLCVIPIIILLKKHLSRSAF